MQKQSLQKIIVLSVVLVFTMTMITLLTFSGDTQNEPRLNSEGLPDSNFRISPPVMPSKIAFCGEHAPLKDSFVREGLDRELLVNTYWHSSTILLLKRANRWFPVIKPILKKNNIPDDFKYLALTESGFTRTVSPTGATGFWQFLEKTAKENGLEVNDEVDERYNVELATEAACRYFHDSHDEYGSWTLAAAAFNAGKRRITESLEKQKVKSYYKLYLNEETSRYIYRILALKIIFENPGLYGFDLANDDLYPVWKVRLIQVDQTIPDLVEFAFDHDITYKILKEYNPWLRSDHLPNSSGKVYFIKIPEKE